MSLRVSGKHMDVGEAFRTRIEERLGDSVAKYFDGNFSGTVVMSKNGARYSADCTVHLDTGVVFQANGGAHDPQPAFEEAAERIEKRLRRYKRRLKDYRAGDDATKSDIALTVMEAIPEETEDLPENYAPAIVAETSLPLSTLSVAGAVMELDRRDSPVVIFRNAASGEVNIVYRRSDGNFGWVDPSTYKGDSA
ncbi:ribosome hibernation-promoting factor, HPF/YfiA family [Consotaella salsifontis]|uniref:Ribosome hibernation promoting factor n=1 Tax=Consotaella salsifontis TaxID=1365950 RepID=A0A1T4QGZ9_9HYPH|nr:ribosome-associated translation inhibitor RaiA [Consotaella salsifontis]SKA03073.1 ribosomal subunit interface protein [Consotaella salsifontis]